MGMRLYTLTLIIFQRTALIDVRGRRPSVQVEKRVTGARNAVSLTVEDEISSKGVFDVWIIFGKDGLIDAGVRLAKINLPPRSLPLVECVEVVGQGYVRVEWIGDAGEGSAHGKSVDDEPVHVVKGDLTRDSQ
jgi:hypothetical protein